MTISMLRCQTRLTILWMSGSVILLLLAWLQIVYGHYGDKGREVVEWLLPSIMPSLSLVVGVWANSVLKKPKITERVNKGIYQTVFIVCLIYLIFIALVFVVQPLVARPPLDVVKESNLILGPLQGVACAVLGVFFTHKMK